ncbi:MAG: hypothetical protein Q8K62_14770 [Thiobacillus sp.]|nr:hypothetical protein [Thiobacillus sp.]
MNLFASQPGLKVPSVGFKFQDSLAVILVVHFSLILKTISHGLVLPGFSKRLMPTAHALKRTQFSAVSTSPAAFTTAYSLTGFAGIAWNYSAQGLNT